MAGFENKGLTGQVLTPVQVACCRKRLEAAAWIDGRAKAGEQSAKVKSNLQVSQDPKDGRGLTPGRSAVFANVPVPLKVFPPPFKCYELGMTHMDYAIRPVSAQGGGSARTRPPPSSSRRLGITAAESLWSRTPTAPRR